MPVKTAKKAVDSLSEVLDSVSGLEIDEQRWVFRAALDKLGFRELLESDDGDGNSSRPKDSRTAGSREPGDSRSQSAPEFFRSKQPKTDTQRIACLAYYVTHSKNIPEFKTGDLLSAETESKLPKISNMYQAVDNATRKAKVLTTTSGGLKQLTTHGEDVVNALPDQDAVKALLKANRAGKRRKRASKKKK